jgi:tetratricopeptide (TPR) repeat protein
VNPTQIASQIIANPGAMPALIARLSDPDAGALVDQLKAEAAQYLWINANRSLELGELIAAIGQRRRDANQIALGMMQRADALRALGRIAEAWAVFASAGASFQAAGNPVGWARTRIGRLLCAVDLNAVPEALADAQAARAIFHEHDQPDRLLALCHSMAIVYDQIGDHPAALALYHEALAIAERLGERGRANLGMLCSDIGYAYHLQGQFERALAFYERAHAICAERSETRGLALIELNQADIAMAQGQHRRALQLLHHARDLYLAEQLPLDATHVGRSIVECYLLLNRHAEARDLARANMAAYASFDAAYMQALTGLQLAIAEAELGGYAAAEDALAQGEQQFVALGATAWVATAALLRGRLALRAGAPERARALAEQARENFGRSGKQVDYAAATLLRGRASLQLGQLAAAEQDGRIALDLARRCNTPPLRYGAHLLLGQLAEAAGHANMAARRYAAANATVERVQRGLTITLRPGFLEDKGEAPRRQIALQLAAGQAALAFESIERAKSQTLLGYLANREQLRWVSADPRCQQLLDQLERLRAEHRWFERLARGEGDPDGRPGGALAPEHARAEVAARERQMRAITERLYLYGRDDRLISIAAPRLADIQARLAGDELLIAFYNDGQSLWAFAAGPRELHVERLPASAAQVERLIAQIQANVDFALRAGPGAPATDRLAEVARRLLQQTYAALLAPLAARIAGRTRLIVVPYGSLHYLPFHLLHDGAAHLAERHELVILPAAGLITRASPRRAPGARVLTHTWDGRLAHVEAEGRAVQRLLGGAHFAEQAARRASLAGEPAQVLHIAAHGQHRLDQPDLSFIELADGQLYTDDLLQQDLSYELVTLSACETGRASVAAGDELIGLGRGFLYAGAGALVTSLWRVADDSSAAMMSEMYRQLRSGRAKSAALRVAQLGLLAERPGLHPAFWGAFQLVGSAEPLSRERA